MSVLRFDLPVRRRIAKLAALQRAQLDQAALSRDLLRDAIIDFSAARDLVTDGAVRAEYDHLIEMLTDQAGMHSAFLQRWGQ